MLSGVLNSERAIKVNIQIMRIYTRVRHLLLAHKDVLLRLEKIDKNFKNTITTWLWYLTI
jgi:hypothetical protein